MSSEGRSRELREASDRLKELSMRSYLAARAIDALLDLVDDPSPRRLKRFLREYRKAVR